jgi:hypothetical protein
MEVYQFAGRRIGDVAKQIVYPAVAGAGHAETVPMEPFNGAAAGTRAM